RDHRIQDLIVFPAAGQLEIVAGAARAVLGDDFFLEDVEFRMPLVLPEDGELPETRLEVYSDEGHFILTSRQPETEHWVEHTRGRINHSGDAFEVGATDLDSLRRRITDPANSYEYSTEIGFVLGPSFRGTHTSWTAGDETLTASDVPAVLTYEA